MPNNVVAQCLKVLLARNHDKALRTTKIVVVNRINVVNVGCPLKNGCRKKFVSFANIK